MFLIVKRLKKMEVNVMLLFHFLWKIKLSEFQYIINS
jgi:hypothetical protein